MNSVHPPEAPPEAPQQDLQQQTETTRTVTSNSTRTSASAGDPPRVIHGATATMMETAVSSPQQQPESAATATTPQQQHHLAMNTPWTLGSTDGAYAMHVAQMLSQTDEEPSNSAAVNTTGAAIAPHTGLAQKNATLDALSNKRSLYQDRLFRQPSASVEAVLASSCEVMGFDIAEMWLRTGPKTHQLTNSHLRPTALEDSVRNALVEVYYGQQSAARTHRLSPALCKRAKEANDVVWVTEHSTHGQEALRYSISNVRTAVAVPVCHEASNTNITIIFFSMRRYVDCVW